MKSQSYLYVLVGALWVLALAKWFENPRGTIEPTFLQSLGARVNPVTVKRPKDDPGYVIPEKRLTQPQAVLPTANPSVQLGAKSRSKLQPTIDRYIQTLTTNGFMSQNQGVWIQQGSEPIAHHRGSVALPGASLTKVATTLVALHTLGAEHRFWTQVAVTGPIQNGVLEGDLLVQGGGDPLFVWQSAFQLGRLLNQRGIRQVQGDLVILGPFAMNFERDPLTAGTLLKQAWNREAGNPRISILGQVRTASPNQVAAESWFVRYPSKPLIGLLKQMNLYSNNVMAEMIGQAIGGSRSLNRTTLQLTGLSASEIRFINASGLGRANRVSPRAACALFTAIQSHLKTQNRDIREVFPIATIDRGTLANRHLPPGTIGKTGTLRNVSTLVGLLPEQSGPPVCFAILNSGGDLQSLRRQQDRLVQSIGKIEG
ncbi:MAG: D-alanyl-D-alanine carboxypeptidase [Leptolyngbyaceae cyanobacterium bins.59]|nr:D-alanyl-D-alanine carboxypeptidase [Leptolyngbyaceae cyanobacterium bins.59]